MTAAPVLGRPYSGRTGVSTAFGTFGELLQGALPGPDGDFLVTLPIARWARAEFHVDPHDDEVRVDPPHKRKSLRLARMVLADSGRTAGGLLRLDGGLPEGKGMASSSADLVATARAVGNAVGTPLAPTRIEALLRQIEPTDGVLYPGVVAYHHRAVRLRAVLGSLPPLTVVGVDEGGTVDTIAFNRIPKPYSAADQRRYAELLDRLSTALATGDLAEVGRVATASARMNEALQPKRTLAALLRISAGMGGLGVVAAHSGTTLGVLLDASAPGAADTVAAVARACCAVAGNVSVHRGLTFSGGVA